MQEKQINKTAQWTSVIDQINKLPEEQQKTLFNSLSAQVLHLQNPTTETVFISPLETLKQTYTPFPEGITMSAENVLNHLEKELKDYLKIFGADDDYIYLNEFRKIEPKTRTFEQNLCRLRKNDLSIPRISSIIPTISARTAKENKATDAAIQELKHKGGVSFSQSKTPPQALNNQELTV